MLDDTIHDFILNAEGHNVSFLKFVFSLRVDVVRMYEDIIRDSIVKNFNESIGVVHDLNSANISLSTTSLYIITVNS